MIFQKAVKDLPVIIKVTTLLRWLLFIFLHQIVALCAFSKSAYTRPTFAPSGKILVTKPEWPLNV